jgi:SAM-dependent methyltransferase
MENLLDRINESLEKYYSNRRESYDEPSQQVGWKSVTAQNNRFKELIKVIDKFQPFSINDLGCGLGDLVNFLNANDFFEFRYFGYDTFQSMIDAADKIHKQSGDVVFKRIKNPKEMSTADYTVASGILNIRFDISDREWLAYIIEMIQVMNEKSIKGFAFNALTSYSDEDFKRPELYYSDPCFLFDYCKKNISRNVALLHDYQEYDFTIIVRK